MPDNVSNMILAAIPYSKSVWPEIRGNSALFIGMLLKFIIFINELIFVVVS